MVCGARDLMSARHGDGAGDRGRAGSGAGMETVREYLRGFLDRAAMPVATVLLWCRVTPNQVSLMGVVLTLVTAALIVDGELLIAGVLYILASSLDLLDGLLARLAKLASRFGAFLDSTVDRISEGVVFTAIAYHFASRGQSVDAALAVLALLGSVLVSYTRAMAEGLGLECKVGIMTRAERVLLVAFGLMLGLLPEAVYLLVALTAISAMQRIMHAFRELYPQG
jgi:CDP-diacylglycerol---glycerol-3-phosphate 3-phosphatidyltransferase